VIQIASLVTVHGQSSPVVKNILTLQDCAQIIGAEVMSFGTEKEVLNRWRVSVSSPPGRCCRAVAVSLAGAHQMHCPAFPPPSPWKFPCASRLKLPPPLPISSQKTAHG